MAPTREEKLVEGFVELADTLVDDFDAIEFLHVLTRRVTDLVDATEASILLADPQGTLQLMASSSEQTRALELFLLQNDQGPCLDCYRAGQRVIVEDLDSELERWPRFVPEARKDGFAAVHALPLRLRQDLIGVLGVFGSAPGRLSDADISACQGMAHIATISLLSQRAFGQSDDVIDQLQDALNSRIVIEQAKGVLAERAGVGPDEAFQQLRRYARNNNRRLNEVARDTVHGNLRIEGVLASGDSATAH